MYVDDDLLKRIRLTHLPVSQICQQALWDALEEQDTSKCDCGASAVFIVQNESDVAYPCRKHVANHLTGVSTVRQL